MQNGKKKRTELQSRLFDNTDERSLAVHLRRRRFRILLVMLGDLTQALNILDIGGTPHYWEMMFAGKPFPPGLHITLLNLQPFPVSRPNFTSLTGDGRSMPQFTSRQFDIVFSNSTIEHVGDFAQQQRMADEVRRVGRRYYIQTPNRNFPIEPHFVFPFFQFMPLHWRVWLVQHFSLGWFPRLPDREKALAEVSSIRLLDRKEMRRLFPEAVLYEERFLGLVKSFVAYTP